MGKIINVKRAVELIKKFKNDGKIIALAGGCFDILHIGHIEFLKEAKKEGDFLFILLESDETIKKLKGENRPINTQEDRAKILEALENVDYIVLLPKLEKDSDYDNLIIRLKPDKIAETKDDPFKSHKQRQAKLVGAEIVEVVDMIKNQSTTKLVKLLSESN
ncbi:MAG: adenylyltransferase/cytidyltransferase family protein [bacterium]|nr:adenylyltransferase/cytidyltransferase family protein [bacterium]